MPYLLVNGGAWAYVDSTATRMAYSDGVSDLLRRVDIPVNRSMSSGQITEMKQDPWATSSKYALGWVYLGLVLMFCVSLSRLFDFWGDRFRIASHIEESSHSMRTEPPQYEEHEMHTARTTDSKRCIRPYDIPQEIPEPRWRTSFGDNKSICCLIAMFRYMSYRPFSILKVLTKRASSSPSGILLVSVAGLVFSILYCFIPRPLFYSTMAFGSPPLAVRAGMLAVGLVPWTAALAAKANLISFLTGVKQDRLMKLHGHAAYLCTVLAIVHSVPFWWQSIHDTVGFGYLKQYFGSNTDVFTSGIVVLALLIFLVLHSLPVLRRRIHQLFVLSHIPISWAMVACLFWHCKNFLMSWSYLYATIVLLVFGFVGRLFRLNWSNPLDPSFLIGEDASITVLPGDAVRVVVPTRQKWKAGQFVYVRLPGISMFDYERIPIASSYSRDIASNYGPEYRDMRLVFTPSSSFSREILNAALKKGPYKTHRAFLEGPYSGIQRRLSAFDTVVLIVGGKGITSVIPHLLELTDRISDGKALTTAITVVWAMKNAEMISWFGEELHVCKALARSGSLCCRFYITSPAYSAYSVGPQPVQQIAKHTFLKRNDSMSKPYTTLTDESNFEVSERLTALPVAHVAPPKFTVSPVPYFPPPPKPPQRGRKENLEVSTLSQASAGLLDFDFGFNNEAHEPQRSLASKGPQPPIHSGYKSKKPTNLSVVTGQETTAHKPARPARQHTPARTNTFTQGREWKTEYGRPDLNAILHILSQDFGRRTCVFASGPLGMRADVTQTVADLQKTVWRKRDRDEVYLHSEDWDM